MKKTFLALAVLLAGCTMTPSTDYTVTGTVTDSLANRQTVYIQRYDGGTKIDSTVVKNNRYTFAGRTDSAHLCLLIVPHEGFANFILEPGNIVVNTNPDTYNQPSGTPMNNELARIVAGEKTNRKQMWTRIHEQKKQYPDSLRFDSVKRVILAKESEDTHNRTMDLLKQHADDAIGYYLLANHNVLPRLQEVVSVLGPWLKSTHLAQTLQRTAAALEHTAEGQPFVDVELKDIHGNPAPLSNYVGRSEYVLLNMWHADCPHCRENMPRLAELHNRFKDQGLTVLGLFLDGATNFRDAIAEHHIKWPQLIDSGKKFGTPYGLNDLHASILFAPDGTILKRNLRGEEMIETVTGLLTGKK